MNESDTCQQGPVQCHVLLSPFRLPRRAPSSGKAEEEAPSQEHLQQVEAQAKVPLASLSIFSGSCWPVLQTFPRLLPPVPFLCHPPSEPSHHARGRGGGVLVP